MDSFYIDPLKMKWFLLCEIHETNFLCLIQIKAQYLALSTVGRGGGGGGESGGLAADNELTSLIAVVRGANENKCEPLHRANTANGRETARTRAGPHSRCRVIIRCLTCSYTTLQLLISAHLWNWWGQLVYLMLPVCQAKLPPSTTTLCIFQDNKVDISQFYTCGSVNEEGATVACCIWANKHQMAFNR